MEGLFLHILHEVEIWNYPLVFWIPAIAKNDTKEEFLREQKMLPQEDCGEVSSPKSFIGDPSNMSSPT